MTTTTPTPEDQEFNRLLGQASGVKISGVGDRQHWGHLQLAAKKKLEETHKAAVEAAYLRGWGDCEAAIKARLGLK
jgi:hypothetical protein